ncbi:MAG: hypothetical protein A2091_01480 [Desulfuromonadales bacterium GWD2_61_12]|nr:MAG: hypothetical protein A2005_02610 [Desulfuromonadales bacterium GWC2_61_20]OGR35298.1 MAG: hypothetical protein A2091_01480 [Desulfuromonadales bacterium GWD2_61_12]HBT82151.1 hypothetical protein [Desulfuromonas sp.]
MRLFANFRSPWLVALVFVLVGCARPYRGLERCPPAGIAPDYVSMLGELERSPLAERERDRLLYLMEKGALLHEAGSWGESNAVLEEAERLSEELFTRSLSREGLSFITNDLLLPFVGEDFEAAAINYYKALNYLALVDLDAARVECRKVDEKLNYFFDSYGGRNVFKESPWLRLLTGLIYEAQGEFNDAFIAYRKSLVAYQELRQRYRVDVPDLLWERLVVSARRSGLLVEARDYEAQARDLGIPLLPAQAYVAVVVNAGLIPVKVEGAVFVPSPQGYPVKIAWPRFISRSCSAQPPAVALNGQYPVPTQQVESLDAIARQSLEDRKGRTIVKLMTRAVSKQVAAYQAERELGPLAGLTAQIAALLTENADLRGWTTLPGAIWLALLPVEPGGHQVAVHASGQEALSRAVTVGRGSIGFVVARIY